MDNLCHTLVGAALAECGLRRRTRYATAALVIGANFPDIDVLALFGDNRLGFRRGITHGLPALILLPLVLTGLILMWDRLVTRDSRLETRPKELLKLSALAILTHPTLDWMNTYGMRWLMPLDPSWSFGDALFIVDPWIWAALALGAAISWGMRARVHGRRTLPRNDLSSVPRGPGGPVPPQPERTWTRPAQASLVAVTLYAALMLALGQTGRGFVRQSLEARGTTLAREPMVAPVFANPSLRYVVADDGARYHVAAFDWWPAPGLVTRTGVIQKNNGHPAVQVAVHSPAARGFVQWARFPFFEVREERDAFIVTMDDARYAPVNGRSWAALAVRVPKTPLSAGGNPRDTTRAGGVWTGAQPPAVAVVLDRTTPETVPRGLASIAWYVQRAARLWCRP
jgi:inner membrane protein